MGRTRSPVLTAGEPGSRTHHPTPPPATPSTHAIIEGEHVVLRMPNHWLVNTALDDGTLQQQRALLVALKRRFPSKAPSDCAEHRRLVWTALWEIIERDRQRSHEGKPMRHVAYAVNEDWLLLAVRARTLVDHFWEIERAAPTLEDVFHSKEYEAQKKHRQRTGAPRRRTAFAFSSPEEIETEPRGVRDTLLSVRRDGLHWPHRDGLKWPHLPSGFLSFE